MVVNIRWATKHIMALKSCYGRAAAYKEISPWLFELLESLKAEQFLSRINFRLLKEIAARLHIATPIIEASELGTAPELRDLDKNMRTLAICQAAGATCYLSGPAAKSYLDEPVFNAHGIDVAWMSYEGYPVYPQLWGAFRAESLNYRPPAQHRRPRERVFPAARRAWCRPWCVTHGSKQIAEGLKLRFDGIERTLDPIMTKTVVINQSNYLPWRRLLRPDAQE